MERSLDQRAAIKFCVKLKKTPLETFQMLQQAFGEDCLSRSQSNRWHHMFLEGRENVADEARSGRPSTSRDEESVERVRKLLNTDRRLSVRLMSDLLDMPKSSVHRIVSENLLMRKVCAKLVPKVLSDEQKHRRVADPPAHCNVSAAAVQSGLVSTRLLFVSPPQEGVERCAFRHHRQHQGYLDETSQQHSRRRLPGCLPGVEEPLAEVYRRGRSLF